MAVFVYQGRTASGNQNGEIEAPDRSAAVGELRRRAILVTKIAEKTAEQVYKRDAPGVVQVTFLAPADRLAARQITPYAAGEQLLDGLRKEA